MLARWGFLLDDLSDDIGGGYFTGEFVLRSDGALLRRAVSSFSSSHSMSYRALGGWQIHHQFEAGVTEETARQWLQTNRYQLSDPPVIDLDAQEGPEVPIPSPPEPRRRRFRWPWSR